MTSTNLDVAGEIVAALTEAEASYLPDLKLEPQGDHAVHVFYAGTAHLGNALVLTEEVIKTVRTLGVTRLADRLVVTGYTKVQRNAMKRASSLDAEADRVRADLVKALTDVDGNPPWRAADAIPYYGDTLARVEAERDLWADLEKHGDVVASVGLALSWAAKGGMERGGLDGAMAVHRSTGARAFVRANALALNDVVPLGLVNALFSL